MSSAKPTRKQADLAEVLELLLDKGIVINADIAVTVGDTELLGVELRAAIASFETAAEYGLAFPSGTDMRRVEQASGREPLDADDDEVDLGIDASDDGEDQQVERAPSRRPNPTTPFGLDDDERADAEETDEDTEEADAEASDEQETENGEEAEAEEGAEAEAEAEAEES